MRRRIRIEVVWANLKIDETEGFERRWLHDWHVFRGAQGRAGNDRACARPQVRRPRICRGANRSQEVGVIKTLEQPEGVTSADKNSVRIFQKPLLIRYIVNRHK